MKKIFLTLCITTTIAGTLIYSFTVKPNKHINTKPAVANDSILNNTNNALVQKTEKPVIDNSTQKVSTDSKKPLAASNITNNSNTSNNTASKVSSKNQDTENNKSVINTTPTSISTVSSSNTEGSSITKSNIDSSSSQNNAQTISTNTNNANNITNTKSSNNANNNNNNNSNTTNDNVTASKTNNSENNINATTIASSNFDSATYSKIQALAGPGTAFVTNLNSYKVVNGVKYYNVYQYSINKDSNGWVYDGNYSNFIGARYMSTSGASLNNQYVQDFSALTESQKKSTLYNLATEFTGYFPQYTGSISVDMNKTKDVDGYHCYLINWGNKSFYINLAGYIYVNKYQYFY